MLTVDELAEKLNVSPRTVYAWIYKRVIPVYKFESGYRFDEQEVDEWVKARKIEPKENKEVI